MDAEVMATIALQRQAQFLACVVTDTPGHHALLRNMLCDGQVSPNMVRANDGYSALMLACESDNLPAIRILLDHGANVNQGSCVPQLAESSVHSPVWVADVSGSSTALILASQAGSEQAVQLLLRHGAKVDNDAEGTSPPPFASALHWAAALGHDRVVDMLLCSGARADAQDGNGSTPLHYAMMNENEQVVRLLLGPRAAAHGAVRIDVQNDAGQTPLMVAAARNNLSAALRLATHRASINAHDAKGWSALLLAAQHGHVEMVELLLDAGADINSMSADFQSTLTLTALFHPEHTESLLILHHTNLLRSHFVQLFESLHLLTHRSH